MTLNENLASCFQSVSSGKSSVASAITGKGVTTASDATFAVMATNIRNISTGKKFASGTLFASSSYTNYWTTVYGDNAGSFRHVEYANVGFTPSQVIIVGANHITISLFYPMKMKELDDVYFDTIVCQYESYPIYFLRKSGESSPHFLTNGFYMPVTGENNLKFTWYAFG